MPTLSDAAEYKYEMTPNDRQWNWKDIEYCAYLGIADFDEVITNCLRYEFDDIGTFIGLHDLYNLIWTRMSHLCEMNSPMPVPMKIRSSWDSSSREMSPRGKTQRPRTIMKSSNWWKVIIQSTSSSLYTIVLSPQFAILSLVKVSLPNEPTSVGMGSTLIADWLNELGLGYRNIKSCTLSELHSLLWLANPVSANHWWAINSISDGIIDTK